MCCIGHANTGEWCEEEIRICAQRVVKRILAMLKNHIKVIVWDGCIFLEVIEILKLRHSQAAYIPIVD